jgi:class 3 adenylate cyclase
VTAGVIGTKKFSYDVWGDAVNLASRLEGLATPGRVLVCPTCRAKLGDEFAFEPRGSIDIKGIGSQETWYLVAPVDATDDPVTPSDHLQTRTAS